MSNEEGSQFGIRPGELIANKYRVDRVLGVGGMGVVVAAHHVRLDEFVAIKLLLPEALADADAVRRFEREARTAVKIKNEHVTRIIDVGTTEHGAPYIVMEYLEGEDLADRVTRVGPLPVEDAIELLLQACEAIAEAHALGIVHRDLKPSNLFCVQGADGRTSVKVLDFGISKFTHAGPANSGLGLTKTKAVMGSPYYMSPEQMESPRNVDERTDIWSLGVVLYQILTGEVPFTGETLPQVCVNVATRPAPSLRKSRPDIANGLDVICLRCLEKDPQKRYPNVAALAAALARFGPRRAQASLDRITRMARQVAARSNTATTSRTERSVGPTTTAPASWGATGKSLEAKARNIVGWSAAAFVFVALAITRGRRGSESSNESVPAVLVTPPPSAAPKETALSREIAPQREVAPIDVQPKEAAPEPPMADSLQVSQSLGISSHSTDNVVSTAPASVPHVIDMNRPTLGAPLAAALPGARPIGDAGVLLSPRATATTRSIDDNEANPYGPSPEKSTSTSGAQPCVLNLNSLPAARVIIDGMPLGFTPRTGVVVEAGEHRVQFHWDGGERRTSVTCAAGETKTVAVRLYDPPPVDDLPVKNPYR